MLVCHLEVRQSNCHHLGKNVLSVPILNYKIHVLMKHQHMKSWNMYGRVVQKYNNWAQYHDVLKAVMLQGVVKFF